MAGRSHSEYWNFAMVENWVKGISTKKVLIFCSHYSIIPSFQGCGRYGMALISLRIQ
jgi:hypothetical protein